MKSQAFADYFAARDALEECVLTTDWIAELQAFLKDLVKADPHITRVSLAHVPNEGPQLHVAFDSGHCYKTNHGFVMMVKDVPFPECGYVHEAEDVLADLNRSVSSFYAEIRKVQPIVVNKVEP